MVRMMVAVETVEVVGAFSTPSINTYDFSFIVVLKIERVRVLFSNPQGTYKGSVLHEL